MRVFLTQVWGNHQYLLNIIYVYVQYYHGQAVKKFHETSVKVLEKVLPFVLHGLENPHFKANSTFRKEFPVQKQLLWAPDSWKRSELWRPKNPPWTGSLRAISCAVRQKARAPRPLNGMEQTWNDCVIFSGAVVTACELQRLVWLRFGSSSIIFKMRLCDGPTTGISKMIVISPRTRYRVT